MLLLSIGCLGSPLLTRDARAQDDPVFESAVYLLRTSMSPDRRGQYSVMLRSLRQMQDPDLRPLFREMVLSDNRVMRIHGILGMAECDSKRQLDLTLLADVKDPAVMSELLSAALDSELMDDAAAKQVLGWEAVDLDAKVVIATHLLAKNQFSDIKLLKEAADTKNLARLGMVALLLTQLGDAQGAILLDTLDKSTEPSRDAIRSLVLQSAFRFKFDRIAQWAAKVSTESGVDERLGMLALRTAMRFGHKPSMQIWTQQFGTTTDPAGRIRLALSLLNLAPYVEPAMFDPMIADADPLMKQMGVAGKAAASNSNVADATIKLIEHDYAMANAWALGYANFHATPEDARAIFTALINAYEVDNERNRSQRLDEAMVAAQALFEKDNKAGAEVLRTILNRESTNDQLAQGIMVGLIRVTKGEPHRVVEGVTRKYDNVNAQGLKLLLLAKHGVSLSPAELKALGVLVRGGGNLPDTLRLQAAWAYLKQTKQGEAALAKALKR